MTTLATHAKEQSTYAFTVAFFDDADTAVTPNTVTWDLRNPAGDVVNSKLAQSETPGTTVTIVLSGNDLVVDRTNGDRRIVHISAPYDSSLGSGLPFRDEVTIVIDELLGV